MKSIFKKYIDEWDPMGLFPCAPDDEYEHEIIEVCSSYRPGMTAPELATIIKNVINRCFAENLEDEHCLPTAEKIINDVK